MAALGFDSWWDEPAYKAAQGTFTERGASILAKLRAHDAARLKDVLADVYRDDIPGTERRAMMARRGDGIAQRCTTWAPQNWRFVFGVAVGFMLGAVAAALAIPPARILDADSSAEPGYLWGWAVYTIHGEFVCAEPGWDVCDSTATRR